MAREIGPCGPLTLLSSKFCNFGTDFFQIIRFFSSMYMNKIFLRFDLQACMVNLNMNFGMYMFAIVLFLCQCLLPL